MKTQCVSRMTGLLFAPVLVALLGACSGEDGQTPTPTPTPNSVTSSSSTPVTAGTPSSNPNPWGNLNSRNLPAGLASGAGHWSGKLRLGGNVLSDSFCVVSITGELSCVLYDPTQTPVYPYYLYAQDGLTGTLRGVLNMANPSQASGSGTLFAAPGKRLADGRSVIANFTITGGTLRDNNSLLDLTLSSMGEVLTLSAYFDHYYYLYLHGGSQSDALRNLSRVYAAATFNGEPASLAIDADGMLFSQTASGCVLNGRVSVIDARYNAYAVNVTVANCPGRNGVYGGVATLIDFAYVNGANHVLFTLFSSNNFIAGEAVDWLDPRRS